MDHKGFTQLTLALSSKAVLPVTIELALWASCEALCILRSLKMCTRAQGYVCGSMQAINVPSAKASVVTFWEGEVVDGRNHTFFTQHVRSPRPAFHTDPLACVISP